MSKEQFCFWLQGILESNRELSADNIALIKTQLERVNQTKDYAGIATLRKPSYPGLDTTSAPYKTTY